MKNAFNNHKGKFKKDHYLDKIIKCFFLNKKIHVYKNKQSKT